MSRHVEPDGGTFYRSLGMSAFRAGLVLVLVAVGTAAMVVLTADLSPSAPAMKELGAAVQTDGDGDQDDAAQAVQPAGSPTAAPAPTATAAATPDRATEVDDEADAPTEPDADADHEEGAAQAPVEPPSQTSVQVLDGGAGPGATQEVVALLRDLGYDIVAVSSARCCYEETTVLYTSGNQPVGRALADRDERFVEVRANPNLSESVDVHVVVGRDWGR